jgi:MATE family multidrug resistance protein
MASRATWNTLWIALVYTAVVVAAYVGFPTWFLAAHSIEGNNFDEIKKLTIAFLRFVAIYSLFDAVQIVFVSAIKGADDTRFVVLATGIASTMFLMVGIFGSRFFADAQDQVNWWWICWTGWVCVLGAIYLIRFLQGKWKNMTVVEPSFLG